MSSSVGGSECTRSMADGWFKTWPERTYDRVDGSTPAESPRHRAAVPLSSLLSHMSLAYSPITKGLHVVTAKGKDSALHVLEDDSPVDLSENSGVPKINIEPDGVGRKLVLQSCMPAKEQEKDVNSLWTSKIGYDSMEADENSKNNSRDEPEPKEQDTAMLRTGASSFSSIVSSLSSDVSPSQGDQAYSVSRQDGDDRSQISFECGEQSRFFGAEYLESPKLAKKKTFSNFISKSLFSWKGGSSSGNSSGNWRILGKSTNLSAEAQTNTNGNSLNSSFRGSGQSINEGGQRYGDVVVSSSALILHDRPSNLPAKSEDEKEKHHQQYRDMVDAAKRKEEKDSKLRKITLDRQLKQEEQLSNAVKTWNEVILPNWQEQRNERRTQELWWAGLPPCVRGRVWRAAAGNDLNITPQLFHICASRAEERLNSGLNDISQCGDGCDNESSMQLIQLDIARTFPQLCIFQKGGPYYDMLHSVLGAYVCYRPDVGYVQGMSFLAAILILNMDPPDAFICFANILNRPCLHAFFSLSHTMVECYYSAYNDLLKENLPKLWTHMMQSGLTPDLYLLDWIYSVFGKAVSLDVACRIWDVFLRDGESFIFRTALGILHMYEKELLELDFVRGAQLLTRLPDTLSVCDLFKSIASIRLNVGKLSFEKVISSHLPR